MLFAFLFNTGYLPYSFDKIKALRAVTRDIRAGLKDTRERLRLRLRLREKTGSGFNGSRIAPPGGFQVEVSDFWLESFFKG